MMDTATIKTLAAMRDALNNSIKAWEVSGATVIPPQLLAEYDALDKALAYVKTMGEIEAAADQVHFADTDKYTTRDYGTDSRQWAVFDSDGRFDCKPFASLPEAFMKVKEQK